MAKKLSFTLDFGLFGPNSGYRFFVFFSKNLASLVTRYHGQLSSYTIPEKKLMIQSRENSVTDAVRLRSSVHHKDIPKIENLIPIRG